MPAYELPRSALSAVPWLVANRVQRPRFLAAAVVHSILARAAKRDSGSTQTIARNGAYAVSTIALVLQFRAAAGGLTVPSALAMQLLTYTFIARCATARGS